MFLDAKSLIDVQEAMHSAGGAYERSLEAATGVYIGCMYTEYLDTVLAPQAPTISPSNFAAS